MTNATTAPVQSLVDEVLAELDRAEKTHLDVEVRDIARDAVRLIREQQAELTSIEAMVGMLEGGEWAEHVGQLGGPIAKRLESEITRLHNEQQALIAQQAATVAVPEGWKPVPVEPTKAMWTAVNKLDDEMVAGGYDGKGCSIEQAWSCMLSAAPAQPAQQSQWVRVTPELRAHAQMLQDDWCADLQEGGAQKLPAWILNVLPSPGDTAAPAPQRKFSGPGHLEQTGYIPAGSAAEREGNDHE